jgi:hypothetical protein
VIVMASKAERIETRTDPDSAARIAQAPARDNLGDR